MDFSNLAAAKGKFEEAIADITSSESSKDWFDLRAHAKNVGEEGIKLIESEISYTPRLPSYGCHDPAEARKKFSSAISDLTAAQARLSDNKVEEAQQLIKRAERAAKDGVLILFTDLDFL